jgi:Spy/CpxP family protein refolding chaperone
MKRVVLFLAVIAAVAALASYATLHFSRDDVTPDEVTSHEWLHRELNLTDAQLKELEPIEAKFGERQRSLAEAMQVAKHHLAEVIAEDKAYTPRVSAAVEHVHHCMGELQKVTIEHVFAMRAVLSPKQGDRLLILAEKALEQTP